MVTVEHLIKLLEDCEPHAVVVLSSDAEGNNFSPLDELGVGTYEPDSSWEGFFHDEHDVEIYEKDRVPMAAVCLWPVN